MVEPIADDAFIVISGQHPQTGKRERISRVRTHITKQYFRKLHHKARAVKQPTLRSGSHQNYDHEHVGCPLVVTGLCNPLPLASHVLLNPSSFATETTRRMQKCELSQFASSWV
jgi:hypothetical protein